jgi:putative ATP-dependent endonuclease of OLD family
MYLSKITIIHFRGIEHLEVNFSKKINMIIGENGRCKSAVIDAIRLLYNLGEPFKEISVVNEDFFEKVTKIEKVVTVQKNEVIRIAYEFRELSREQKGAFYEYMVVNPTDPDKDHARIEIQYRNDKRYPVFTYSTGNIEGQKADTNTFRLFQHYYLSALRDSTRDLLSNRNNILGKVIKRLVEREKSEDAIRDIIKNANIKLLERQEVQSTRANINDNLDKIYKHVNKTQIGLQIEQSRIDYIVNVIKPFLPHDWDDHSAAGFNLHQNSLGFNNLIYIATVLGDIKERAKDDPIPHFTLLIEEPEAHIHPQLQLSLYNFLKEANDKANSQLFITTHSPTLTSKVPFKNLILLEDRAFTISKCFKDREGEKIIQDTIKKTELKQPAINEKRKQLQRYIDVTKSQLFFARRCLLVEGISEELLITALCKVEGFALEDYRIELVNVDGISFYPFLFLFNSSVDEKRIPKSIAILTDDDRFPASSKREFKLEKLVENTFAKLDVLHGNLDAAVPKSRINNLDSVKNKQATIDIQSAYQTMELDLCRSNVPKTQKELSENFLFRYIEQRCPEKNNHVKSYLGMLDEQLGQIEQEKIAILLWKCLPPKAQFAQDLSGYMMKKLETAKETFIVPHYIKAAFSHLKQ